MDNEQRLADALTALSATTTGVGRGFEQRLSASETRMDAAMQQPVGVMDDGMGSPSAPKPRLVTSGARCLDGRAWGPQF